jgi:hypothetical protein
MQDDFGRDFQRKRKKPGYTLELIAKVDAGCAGMAFSISTPPLQPSVRNF